MIKNDHILEDLKTKITVYWHILIHICLLPLLRYESDALPNYQRTLITETRKTVERDKIFGSISRYPNHYFSYQKYS